MVTTQKPLLSGAKDQWILAAPAMRIAVREIFDLEQGVHRSQLLDDRVVGLEHAPPSPFASFSSEVAAIIDRRQDREAIAGADYEIFVAVAGRGMHQSG